MNSLFEIGLDSINYELNWISVNTLSDWRLKNFPPSTLEWSNRSAAEYLPWLTKLALKFFISLKMQISMLLLKENRIKEVEKVYGYKMTIKFESKINRSLCHFLFNYIIFMKGNLVKINSVRIIIITYGHHCWWDHDNTQ